MARIKTQLILFFLLILNLACSESNLLYNESFPIPENGWSKEHKLKDSWIAEKSISQSAVTISITHSPGFGYENLYLTGKIAKGGHTVWADTFSIQLAKSNSGQWLGHNQGDSWMLTDTLEYSLSVEKGEEIQFDFAQFSREELLREIETVEIKVVDVLK